MKRLINNSSDTRKSAYNYYWFHHNAMDTDQMDRINNAIVDHDWNSFLLARDYYDSGRFKSRGRDILFFPDHIHVIDLNNNSSVIPLTQENFNKIQYSECECG